jgi:hypothetical protein
MLPLALFAAQEITPLDASDPYTAQTEATPKVVSVRVVAGFGAGDFGLAGRIGVQDEYWFARQIGFGVVAGAAAQSRILGDSSELLFVAPSLSFRSAATGSWWILVLSPGYAHREDEFTNLCFWASCDEGYTVRRQGVYFGATAGFVAHAGPVELGPLLQLDSALTDGRATGMVTLNLALGFATD